jgi:hypothetical protein
VLDGLREQFFLVRHGVGVLRVFVEVGHALA